MKKFKRVVVEYMTEVADQMEVGTYEAITNDVETVVSYVEQNWGHVEKVVAVDLNCPVYIKGELQ